MRDPWMSLVLRWSPKWDTQSLEGPWYREPQRVSGAGGPWHGKSLVHGVRVMTCPWH